MKPARVVCAESVTASDKRDAERMWKRTGNPATAHEAFKEILADAPPAIVNFGLKLCALANERGFVLPGDRGIVVLGSISLDLFLEIFTVMSDTIAGLALAVFSELEPSERQELARLVTDRLKKPASLEQVGNQGKSILQVLVSELVEKEVEALRPVVEHRVRELVKARWEAEVEPLVRAKLDSAVAKVKAELVRG